MHLNEQQNDNLFPVTSSRDAPINRLCRHFINRDEESDAFFMHPSRRSSKQHSSRQNIAWMTIYLATTMATGSHLFPNSLRGRFIKSTNRPPTSDICKAIAQKYKESIQFIVCHYSSGFYMHKLQLNSHLASVVVYLLVALPCHRPSPRRLLAGSCHG